MTEETQQLNLHTWIQVSEDEYNNSLKTNIPLSMRDDAFLLNKMHVGDTGELVYPCYRQMGEEFYTRHLTRTQFEELQK